MPNYPPPRVRFHGGNSNALNSKSIIDEIDRVLAKHDGFTDEELDVIPSTSLRAGINDDITYWMGQEAEGEDE